TTIYARERGSAPAKVEEGKETKVAYLDVPIAPCEPIHVGQKARILLLSPCDELFPSEEETTTHYYTAEDVGLWGTVVGIRVVEENMVEFILENENIKSATAYAYLAVARREGLTVRMPPWTRWLSMAGIGLARTTRTVLIEDDTTIFED
ncbi:hypothetical protein OH77DRAFT_1359654, partial [Trametes cingulata]